MNKGGPGDLPQRPQPGDLPPSDHRNPGGSRQTSNTAKEAYSYLHSGHIIHVDTETMVCSVQLDSMQAERHDVPIPAAGGSGPRSWSGCIPEPFSKVIIGWKKFDSTGRSFSPYIVEFLTSGTMMAHDYEPFSSTDPSVSAAVLQIDPTLASDPHMNLGVIRLKARKGYPGDYIASSSGGADIILDKDAFFTNRAGNEFRLRDADQTSILQVRNEFVSNAVGFYRRGLIKRNAFAFLPDLYPLDDNDVPANVISPGDPANGVDANGEPLDKNPAYDTLLSFGLIQADGTLNFQDSTTPQGYSLSAPSGTTAQPGDTGTTPFYPPVVTPDGQHISYITHGEHVNSMAATLLAYTEDRSELRHLSDGTMAVTEEGDGFQIDPPFPVFIEDVKGTYVGNDFHSDAGRPLYKRVLGMRLFSNPNQGVLSTGPTYEPVDTVQRLSLMDALGLARLFRIQCPYQDSSNQFVFGITKEGKVLCHVPKTQVGEPDEKGKSIDLNVLGLIKAIVGGDENNNNQSIDLRTLGGINLEVGRFTGGTNAGASIALTLHGGIKRTFNSDPATGVANDDRYNGSALEAGTASKMIVWSGNYIVNVGGEFAQAAQKITLNAGSGGLIGTCAGDYGLTVLGDTQIQFTGKKPIQTTYAFGEMKKILTGTDMQTALVGGFIRTVVAGTGISETCTAGNYLATVAAGNFTVSVATGNFAATVAAGNIALTASAGSLSLTTSLTASIVATVMTSIMSPITAIGAVTAGYGVAGSAGPPSPHIDYIVGIPILGIPTLTVG